MVNMEFKQIDLDNNIQTVIKEIFNVELSISGGWGYDSNSVTIIEKLNMPINQFTQMFATMRLNIEMNLTLEENERYTGINTTFEDSKKLEVNNEIYDVFSFKVTAMKEKEYANFIKEYKDGYGKEEFDLSEHFKRRTQSTISRNIDCWFLNLENS